MFEEQSDASSIAFHRNKSAAESREALEFAKAEELSLRICANPLKVVIPGEDFGKAWVRCNSRLKSRCPACSRQYLLDWRAIAMSGVLDYDDMPIPGERVALVTLTAPSFGPVHSGPHRVTDRLKKCACGDAHPYGDPVLGSPVHYGEYDYQGSLDFNLVMPQLLKNTVAALRRNVDPRLQYFAVTEPQRRAVAHKHLLVRVTGTVFPVDLVKEIIRGVTTEDPDANPVQWGEQMRIDPIHVDPGNGTPSAVNYMLKRAINYSLKDVDSRTGFSLPAIWQMMVFARSEYICSEGCDDACTDPIHSNLGSGRNLSCSRNWSYTGLTRRGQRAARQEYAQAMEERYGIPNYPPESLGEEQLRDSELVKKYLPKIQKRQAERRRAEWERNQENFS